MTQGPSEGGVSVAARLLAREKQVAALESGSDIFMAGAAGECLACLHGPLLADPARVGLVVVPDGTHDLCRASKATNLPVRAMVVTPDSTDEERRALGIALQNRRLQLLIVTPERLGQARFVQFIRGLSLVYVAVASSQRLLSGAQDYCAPYESCRALRSLFPGVPLLALAEDGLPAPVQNEIAAALEMVLPAVAPAANSKPAPAPSVEKEAPAAQAIAFKVAPPRSPAVKESHRAAFPLFEKEIPVTDAARQLGQEEPWVWQALESFIRFSGRTHPFPWVSKPVYLTVSMAAGQAESTNARLITSVLRGQVDEGPVLVVLAALDNRNQTG